MNRQCDIVCFSLSRWDSAISSPALSLAKEFAKNNRVFFIEHPFSWKDFFAERKSQQIKWRKKALLTGKDIYANPPSLPSSLTIVTPRLTIPINFLPPGFLYNQLAAINDKIVLKAIRSTIKDFGIKNFIYVNFSIPILYKNSPPISGRCAPFTSQWMISARWLTQTVMVQGWKKGLFAISITHFAHLKN